MASVSRGPAVRATLRDVLEGRAVKVHGDIVLTAVERDGDVPGPGSPGRLVFDTQFHGLAQERVRRVDVGEDGLEPVVAVAVLDDRAAPMVSAQSWVTLFNWPTWRSQ